MHMTGEQATEADPSSTELARWLSGVHSFTAAANGAATMSHLSSLVASTACELMRANFCGVLLLRTEDRRLIMEASHGFSVDYAGMLQEVHPLEVKPEDVALSPSSRAFISRAPVVVNDVETDPLMKTWRRLAQRQGYRSLISVPLLAKDRPLGVLNCYHREVRQFAPSTVELLSILGNQVGVAMEAIYLREQQRENIARLKEANEQLRSKSLLLQQAQEVHVGLYQVALSGGGLDELAAALGDLLHRPVLVDDVFGHSLLDGAEEADAFRGRPAGPVTPESNISEHHDPEDPNRVWSVVPIVLMNETVARIWVPGPAESLAELDRRALREGGVIAALDLLRHRSVRETESRVHHDIVNVLLNGHPSEFEVQKQRARQIGVDLAQPLVVVVCDVSDVVTDQSSSRERAIERRGTEAILSLPSIEDRRGLVASNEQHLVALLPVDVAGTTPDGLHHLGDTVRAALNAAFRTSSVTVSVSDVCVELSDVAPSFRAARGLLLLRDASAAPGTLVGARLGLVGLLLQIDDTEQLRYFSRRRLDPLREHDAAHGSSLVETLSAYFEHQGSLDRTAKAMFVHPNTVRLRLRKVESILGMDLSERTSLIDLHTALLVDRVASARDSAPPLR